MKKQTRINFKLNLEKQISSEKIRIRGVFSLVKTIRNYFFKQVPKTKQHFDKIKKLSFGIERSKEGVNFTNVLRAAFANADPKNVKRHL